MDSRGESFWPNLLGHVVDNSDRLCSGVCDSRESAAQLASWTGVQFVNKLLLLVVSVRIRHASLTMGVSV